MSNSRRIFFSSLGMKIISAQATYYNKVEHLPLLDDMTSGIRSALNKLVGECGTASYIWKISENSLQLDDSNNLIFKIELESPLDQNSVCSFAGAFCLVKAFGFDRVVVRVLTID